MSKLNKIRVFVKDANNNYYRICSVSNPKDRKGEHYLKIMFPDIKGLPLITGIHNRGTVKPTGRLAGGVQEFSHHYRSGISHFKNSTGYIDSKKDRPTLIDHSALHLLRYTIRSLDIFEKQNSSKVSNGDFVLPNVFTTDPRGYEFAISRISGPWKITNDQGRDPIDTYKIPLEDANVSLHIADGIWRRPPISESDTLFEIFTHDNPVSPFTFTPLK